MASPVRSTTSSTPRPVGRRRAALAAVLAACSLAAALPAGWAAPLCPAERATPQMPTRQQLELCKSLDAVVRRPSALPLNQYEEKLGEYLGSYCHRNPGAGWKTDKRIRDTGPYIARLSPTGVWSGNYNGTHAPVIVWYSPEMYRWLKLNRPQAGRAPASPPPIPDGAIMVKEMYPSPSAACAGVDPTHLLPTSGAAVMVRDNQGSADGWFWGWYGWGRESGWAPDWPAAKGNPLPNMGFGQYCTNCHASARDNQTFAGLRNIKGEKGEPLVYLIQSFFLPPSQPPSQLPPLLPSEAAGGVAGQTASLAPPLDLHQRVTHPPRLAAAPPSGYDKDFATALPAPPWLTPPTPQTVSRMPSETYDNVWVAAHGPRAKSQFVTSDQCLGCHDAGSTGLQYDMTAPNPDGTLQNLSPYATWRTSPMGLGGRDPVFYAQLASETQRFHPTVAPMVEDACLGCHGIMGQRQFRIDSFAAGGQCPDFPRAAADAVPYPSGNKSARLANYGALARDGVSCTACHHMVQGAAATRKFQGQPQNACVAARQDLLNPGLRGVARTFTGSFLVGAPERIAGPFAEPKPLPMRHALGMIPEHDANVLGAELCGTCHTVHLPVLRQGRTIGHVYEQTTYPEWAFSAYRTGTSPDGKLPYGPGERAQTCQGCHMPSQDSGGRKAVSRIASIQEYSNFPEAENTLGAKDIDLAPRPGYATHTLLGLNLFFLKMAQQFPDVLGIRTQDPMLGGAGSVPPAVDPIGLSESALIEQAAKATAAIAITRLETSDGILAATVQVTNRTGHKFPSGVGFRRAFIELKLLDGDGKTLWASGRTDGAGRIVDESGKPLVGEVWWTDDCSARIAPGARAHLPHFQRITRQNEAQIYQALESAPPAIGPAVCGPTATPEGELTTSFLSICAKVKDNRLLPDGTLPLDQRAAIAAALGAGRDLAQEAGATGVGDDPDYRSGGGDSLDYRVALAGLAGPPAAVQATLYYQATPPFFLQDRFCTAKGDDASRLYFLAGNLDLAGTPAAGWKLRVVDTGPVKLP